MNTIVFPGLYKGKICVPPSKSISQRALLLSALAKGKSTIFPIGNSADEQTLLSAIQKMGANVIKLDDQKYEVEGINNFASIDSIEIQESALSFRLLLPCLALFEGKNRIEAKGTLQKRPMEFYQQILPFFGVKIIPFSEENSFEIRGPLKGCEITIDASQSSQFLSGLLISLCFAKENSLLHVPKLNSKPYIDLTIDVMKSFGLEIENTNLHTFSIRGKQKAEHTNYFIESDWSSASFFIIAAALGQDIHLYGLNKNSKQADKKIIEVLEQSNCHFLWEKEYLKIDGKSRKNLNFDCSDCPDLIPILSVCAAFTLGLSKLKGAHRLIHKESNRLTALIDEWKKLDINVYLSENDELCIEGKKEINGGVEINSYHDHRIAMSFAIAGMFTQDPIKINHSESVNKSFPNFWDELDKLKKN